jgi:hypothetical protein
MMVLLVCGIAQGQQILQQGFEAKGPYWKAGSADTSYKVIRHALTDTTALTGQRSEHLRLQVEKGSYIHFTYDLPRAPVTDDLSLSLGLKSSRPGVQLFCRVVLPRERDPKDPTRNLTALIRCEPYNSTRWKTILLLAPVKALREQERLLNLKLGREISTAGAYVDQLILNVYDGPGTIDVFIDDLIVGPVIGTLEPGKVIATPVTQPGAAVPSMPLPRILSDARFAGKRLMVADSPFFMRGIRHTGMPLNVLNDALFNTLFLEENVADTVLKDASQRGFKLVPSLEARRDDLPRRMSRFLESEAVLAWNVGGNLDADRFEQTRQFALELRHGDPSRLLIADVWDHFLGYDRSLDGTLIGTHRWPLSTSLELDNYRRWLAHRRNLTRNSYAWTWIQTHSQEWFMKMLYPKQRPAQYQQPIGPLPEQIRLLSYIALAAGYRGLAFWSDEFLADSHQGRDRLLGLALLNQELKLLERILLEVTEAPEWIDTSNKDIKAAVFRVPKNVLVLPVWIGPGAQYVPGQAAASHVEISIPAAPTNCTAWEVTPGRITHYPIERDSRGAVVKLENFSLTSALVLTSDMTPKGMLVHLQSTQKEMAPAAADWMYKLAKEELAKIEPIDRELHQAGVGLSDGPSLLTKSRKALEQCERLRVNRQHSESYVQAEVALRALRLLMRSHWERAVRDLDTPTASPYAVSFYTLPQHHAFLEELRGRRAASSVLPHGDFEVPVGQSQTGWTVQEVPSLDPVTTEVRRTREGAHGGKGQCVQLSVRAKDPRRVPAALERTFVALHSPAVKLPPGTLVRVSGWVKIPGPITASADGALLYDSAGGEPLAVRLTGPVPKWKPFALYRRVPESGQIHVTMALAGLGTVYFDDIKIEPLVR